MFKNKIPFFYGTAVVVACGYALLVLGLGSYYSWPNAEVLYLTGDIKASHLFYAAQGLLQNYDGRYFTDLLHGINPVAWGWVAGYKLMPLVGVLLFGVCVFFWLLSLFKMSRQVPAVLALSFTVIHFALSPHLVSELFSMIGSYVYLYGICFWMIWTGALWRFINSTNEKQDNFWFFISAFSLIAATGCNEQILLLNALTLGFLFLLFAIANTKHLVRIIPLVLVGVICAVFFVSCPGWRVRMAIESPVANASHPNMLLISMEHFAINIKQLFTKSGFLFSAFLLICLSVGPVTFVNPGISNNKWLKGMVVLYFFIAAYLITLAYYLPMSNIVVTPYRVFNVVNTLLQLMFCTLLLSMPAFVTLLRSAVKIVLVIWCAAALLFGHNNYSQIIGEYCQGLYQPFDQKMKGRLATIQGARASNKEWEKACVEWIAATENTINYPVEMQPNRAIDNRNIAYEKYFGLDEVCYGSDTVGKANELINMLHD